MGFTIHNNASALQAFSRQMAVSANNIANVQSDGFKAGQAHNLEGKNGQVTTHITQSQEAGPLVEDPKKNDGTLKELSNTDMARELVQQITIQHGFDANAKTIQTYDETLGTLIDTVG